MRSYVSMKKLLAAIVLMCVALVSCGDDGPDPPASSDCKVDEAESSDPCFYRGRAILKGEGDSVLLEVEIAETAQQKERGLMGRKELDEEAGMVFVFFEESSGGFWMKNTLIPLSIAFFDERGRIVDILDMEPCTTEDCPIYTPKGPYFGALEVNQGAFADWGISIGDDVEVVQGDRDRLFG